MVYFKINIFSIEHILIKNRIKYLKINNIRIEYFEGGEGQPLLFLHGVLSSFRFYKKLLEKLATKYTVIAPVLPGMGKSQSLGGKVSFRNYCSVIETFINRKEIKPILVGHSLGGAVLAKVAVENPKIASKLILTNSAGIPFDNFILRAIQGLVKEGIKDSLQHQFNPRKGKIVPLSWDTRNTIINRPLEVLRIASVVKGIDLTNDFQGIQNQTLLIWSDDDKTMPKDSGETIHKLIPTSKFKMTSGGHNWLAYDPDKCFEIVDKFVTRG